MREMSLKKEVLSLEKEELHLEKAVPRSSTAELMQKRGNSEEQKTEARAAEPGKQRKKKEEEPILWNFPDVQRLPLSGPQRVE